MPNPNKTGRDHGFKITKRLLGKILVEGEFVAPGELQAAVERQKRSNGHLGEILVGMGVLNPTDLKAVLAVQRDLSSLQNAMKAASGVRLFLGELLLRSKRISRDQLDLALNEQRRTGEKIGEILLRRGLITRHELEGALAFQRRQRSGPETSERFRLGEILVATEQITRGQLEDVLRRQKLSKKKIGELLVEAGYAQPHQVVYGLKLQQKLMTAALIAGLSMSQVLGAGEAYSDAAEGGSAKIAVSAAVLEHTSMRIIAQAPELIITNADIGRGSVEVPAAARIHVNSNNPAGYLLAVEVMSGPYFLFDSMSVILGGREIQLSPSGGWIPQPYIRGGATLDVSCRFVLSKDARPGTYSWPLVISVIPM